MCYDTINESISVTNNNTFTIGVTNTSGPGQLTSYGRCVSGHLDIRYLEIMLME